MWGYANGALIECVGLSKVFLSECVGETVSRALRLSKAMNHSEIMMQDTWKAKKDNDGLAA